MDADGPSGTDLPTYDEAVKMGMESPLKGATEKAKLHKADYEKDEEETTQPSAPGLDEQVAPTAPTLDDEGDLYHQTSRLDLNPPALGAMSGWHEAPPPPLSSVCDYQDTRLYHLLLRLKDAIDKVTKEIQRIKQSDDLGIEIKELREEALKEMKDLALARLTDIIMKGAGDSSTNRNVDSHTWDEKLMSEGLCKLRSDKLFEETQAALRDDLAKLMTWIWEQQRIDYEWTGATARIPTLSTPEKVDMNNTMMALLNRRVDLHCHRESSFYHMEVTLHDYAEDLVVKQQLETLWSLLTRIANSELKK